MRKLAPPGLYQGSGMPLGDFARNRSSRAASDVTNANASLAPEPPEPPHGMAAQTWRRASSDRNVSSSSR
jgi:hypothetical protein